MVARSLEWRERSTHCHGVLEEAYRLMIGARYGWQLIVFGYVGGYVLADANEFVMGGSVRHGG